ncbi:MAG: VWA domain-containing protein [Proteobacteria bacterium]|nr:VWA domain-containing protein [Pseudomonadota bacterium]MBU1687848.1 VWA domain-containing protein [Pseudomonadota bacterium]
MDEMKKKLRRVFEELSTPTPDRERKERNISQSTMEFSQYRQASEKNRQGFSFLGRLTVKLIRLLKLPGGTTMQTSGKLIGAFATAMLAVVIGTSIYQSHRTPVLNISTIKEFTVDPAVPMTSPPQTAASSTLREESTVTKNIVPPQPIAPSLIEEGGRRQVEQQSLMAGDSETKRDDTAGVTAQVAELEMSDLDRGAGVARPAQKSEALGRAVGKMKATDSLRSRALMPMVAVEIPAPYYQDEGRDTFEKFATATVHQVAVDPVSTFSADVDTASYAFVRRQLNNGVLPQKNAVRVEEMINYFEYDYPTPTMAEKPFQPTVAVYPTPWNASTKLLHIGIKGYTLPQAAKPVSNLVFLIDVSGSMNSPDKLPLAKNALRMLVDTLDPRDTVGLVVYAGAAGVVLEPTAVKEKGKILAALDNLSAGGSTAGGQGIRLAYALAERNLIKDGVNRVMLFSDGDFNVGIIDREELKSFIEKQRQSGICFSVFGFGQGNYNDALMQALAQNGNGNAAYIDTLNEARKVLVDQASATLFTIATDLKFQVEFNPALVKEYRLIGYETRALNQADFNNDRIDAGDIGSGHRVTAIYEITPVASPAGLIDDLRYSQPEKKSDAPATGEYAFLKIRYKLPGESQSRLLTQPVDQGNEYQSLAQVPTDLRFASAVAAFGQLLRGGDYTTTFGYPQIIDLANGAKGADSFGYRAEFINLVRLAMTARAM